MLWKKQKKLIKNKMVKKKINITKAKMQRYENVRQSGVTNMFMITTVVNLTGLTKDEIIYIMKNYNTLIAKYAKDYIRKN